MYKNKAFWINEILKEKKMTKTERTLKETNIDYVKNICIRLIEFINFLYDEMIKKF